MRFYYETENDVKIKGSFIIAGVPNVFFTQNNNNDLFYLVNS